MAQRLLVVETATRSIVGDGVTLYPPYANDRMPVQTHPLILRSQPCPAVLRRPDGSTLACTMRTGSLHVSPIEYSDPHWYSFYWLPEIRPDQVPPGTEVWVEDSNLLSPEEIREQEAAFFREMDELEGKTARS